jgi:hypothetical protein
VANPVEDKLNLELKRLKTVLGLNPDLRVIWIPNINKSLSGEVAGKNILIYELNEEKALNVLRHEAIDYLVSQAVEPYKEVSNRLIQMINEETYNRKEKVVESLMRLIK